MPSTPAADRAPRATPWISQGTLALALLLAAACQKDQGRLGTPPAIQPLVALTAASSCNALESSVQEIAVQQMRAQMQAMKTWYGGPIAAAGGADGAPKSTGAPSSYTTTNTQVAGVDEADFVKNDGTRIFVLSNNRLYAARSWPPESLALAGKLELEGWPSEMFLDGDQVVVFSSIWAVPDGGGMGPDASKSGAMMPCALDGMGCFYGWSTTKITVVDVSDLAAPRAVSEIYLPGSASGSRRVGSSVRLVLTDGVRWPAAVKWWPDYDPVLYSDQAKWKAAIDALADANERVIRAAPIEQWFPRGQRKLPGGQVIDVGYQCTDFWLSNAPERLGLVTVATLDLAHLEQGVSRASIVGEAGVLYATKDHLYLANQHWWWWSMGGQRDWTYLHLFDISDPAKARYVASGGVEGHVGDQFALDEKDGYLRIATTTVTWSEDPSNPNWLRTKLSNRLSVLAPQPVVAAAGEAAGTGNRLAIIGELAPLEDEERIMAMRFTGDTGFAVTFRNFDPLITLDLSDPAHPKKIAELTVDGFSTYLQPIDAGHLLSIGVDLPLDAAGRPDWSKRSLQLSLFDVRDLSAPKRTAQALVGTAWAYSEALWDHHAFNWYPADALHKGLLAIPFSDWLQSTTRPWWDEFVSDLRVFAVDPAGSIQPVGKLGMGDVYLSAGDGSWSWWYRPWVRRSVMATDQAGQTFVYAVADAGLRVAALGHLGKPLATVLFPRPGK